MPVFSIVDSLSALLRYKGFVNNDKSVLQEALALFATENIDPVDCVMIAAGRHGHMKSFSFDKRLNRLFERLQESADHK